MSQPDIKVEALGDSRICEAANCKLRVLTSSPSENWKFLSKKLFIATTLKDGYFIIKYVKKNYPIFNKKDKLSPK